MAKTKIAVLVSGGGTNLQALIDAQGKTLVSGKITLVVANNAGAYALERAKKAGIDTAVVLKTSLGTLILQGSGLKLKTLSLDGGQVAVDGTISAMVYQEPRAAGFLQRFFG